uniref:Cathepsin n=1 Tax=Geodia cydonium TaxID=6047 RepID=Q967D5_GEOCY|nr:cathepsin [Geodia cydonium]
MAVYLDWRTWRRRTRVDEWEQWKLKYNKQYSSQEEDYLRQRVWLSNLKFVEEFDSEREGYTVAMNEFADLDPREFVSHYNGLRRRPHTSSGEPCTLGEDVSALPTTVDWRTKGYVTGVKNQGQCGSCWAFSATGSLEGQHFNATGKLVSLSEQNLVDCSSAEGNEGCNGGLPDDAFKYVIKNGGIDTEASYPYVARDEKCHYSSANIGSTCSSYVDIESKSEAQLQVASATVGPIPVGIDASHLGFQLYDGGVYHSDLCSQTRLDHGVLVVGYGVYKEKDYWMVKNSWGTNWGISGDMMMSRNRDNNCGIATMASYPVVKAN